MISIGLLTSVAARPLRPWQPISDERRSHLTWSSARRRWLQGGASGRDRLRRLGTKSSQTPIQVTNEPSSASSARGKAAFRRIRPNGAGVAMPPSRRVSSSRAVWCSRPKNAGTASSQPRSMRPSVGRQILPLPASVQAGVPSPRPEVRGGSRCTLLSYWPAETYFSGLANHHRWPSVSLTPYSR